LGQTYLLHAEFEAARVVLDATPSAETLALYEAESVKTPEQT
jgi:hypothetical protein